MRGSLIALLTLFPSMGFAVRELISAPVEIVSVAGALVCTDPADSIDPLVCRATNRCVSAGVGGAESFGGGVAAIIHQYSLQVANVSNLTQTVNIRIKPGVVGYSVTEPRLLSSAPMQGVPISNPPTLSTTVTLASRSVRILEFQMTCYSGSTCTLSLTGSSSPTPPTPADLDTKTPYTCQGLRSSIQVLFSVNEDRGAIQAQINTAGHRVNGIADHIIGSTGTILINGGRPF